jgi:hypothetical protein
LRSVLVTLRESALPEQSCDLVHKIETWEGVVKAGKITADPHVPPYFFVYTDANADLDEILERLKHSDIVRGAQVPPQRYAVR